MIARDDNKSFIRMFLSEFQSRLDGIIKSHYTSDTRRGVVGMASVIDLAAFAHHEEALLAIKHLYAFRDKLRKGRLFPVEVYGKIQSSVGEHAPGFGTRFERSPFLAVCRHQITGLARKVKNVSTIFRIFPVIVLPAYTATGEIVETTRHKIECDLVGKPSSFTVCIESGRSGMVYGDGGDYAHLHAFTLCGFRDRLQTGSIRGNTKHPIVGLPAARDGGSGGCGISDDCVGRSGARIGLVRHTVHRQFASACI